LPTSVNELTQAQRAALVRYRARWAAIRRSTQPADRGAAEDGMRLAYESAGLKPPARFVWCESPIALSRLARAASRADGRNVKSVVVDNPHRQVKARIRRRVCAAIGLEVNRTVSPADELVAAAAELIDQFTGTFHDGTSLLTRIRNSRLSWSSALDVLLGGGGFGQAAAGPRELSWLGTCEYFRTVLGLKEETTPLLGLLLVATNAGWLRPHEHTCWLSERPNLLRGDPRDRLHNASGPALRFPDGWAVWAWKGAEIPSWIIERPERITLATIDRETDVRLRRCMIDIMTPARYVALGGAFRVAEDETGILWRRTWPAHDAWAAVEVINATPEQNGTRKHFFLQVPAHIRTARAAVAWTYGLRPRAYRRLTTRT
jgi:Domain of unknown function (DUF6745)